MALRSRGIVFAALLCTSIGLAGPSWGAASLQDVRAVGTELRITLSDGRRLTGRQLIGAVLAIDDGRNGARRVRIDAVEPDPADPDHEIQLYTLSVQDAATGAWSSFCAPGPDGIAKGFPLSGTWTEDGRHLPDAGAFALVCTAGAVGKCVRWGYKPWREAANGESLWDYHQACVRMVRADYGGDGIGHTRDDTPIDVYDRLGIEAPADNPGKLDFEAAWGVDGATCVRKPRIPEMISLARIAQRYPRLRGHTGESCRADKPDVRSLIFNRS